MTMESLRVPAFCPICSGLMKGRSTHTFYSSGCCVDCFIFFVEGREQKWKDGWRPDDQQLQRMREFMKD
jgi:hypothetical protein